MRLSEGCSRGRGIRDRRQTKNRNFKIVGIVHARDVSLSVQQTKTIAASLTTGVTTASPQLQSGLTSILNNANLSTTDKFTKMTTAITNDPNLSATDKTSMLAALAAQQKSLSGGAQ